MNYELRGPICDFDATCEVITGPIHVIDLIKDQLRGPTKIDESCCRAKDENGCKSDDLAISLGDATDE